jgi:cell division protein ZipA
MDEMRIILIIIGLILLAAIYWLGRRDERRAQEKKALQERHDPLTGTIADDVDDDLAYDRFFMSEADNEIIFKSPVMKETTSPATVNAGYSATANTHDEAVFVSMEEPAPQAIELPAGVKPLIINLTVLAPQDMTFKGNHLKQTLDESGMSHGDMSIYHYFRKPKVDSLPSRGQRLFSIANMVEPGYFDPTDLNTYQTPGIVLFLQLPGPIDGVLAFEKMHQMGEMLAKRLSGVLCDEKLNKITPQSITHIKDEISEYSLKLRTKLAHTVH